jgi:hypothetical protein
MAIKTGEKMYAADILNLTFFPKGTILTFSTEAWNNAGSPVEPGSLGFKDIWKVCNAANHATDPTIPDLTNMFLRGADSSGVTGGANSDSVTLTADNLPSHNHGATGLSLSNLTTTEGGSHEHTLSGGAASAGSHSHSIYDPGHAHSYSSPSSYHRSGPDSSHVAMDDRVSTTTGGSQTGISINYGGAHEHGFSSTSKAVAVAGHTHGVTGGTISGSTANAGSSQAFTIVPSYYTVIYIIKVV